MFIAKFGSKCRGDFDLTSDTDVICVSDSPHEFINFYSTKNINNTCYYDISYAMSATQKGSLFFKHIIDEGVFICGNYDDFLNISKAWSPSMSLYSEEINSNIDLIEVLKFVPNTIAGRHVAVDIIATSVRNVLIRKNATNGVYNFSWIETFNTAKKFGYLAELDIEILLRARVIKNNYRNLLYSYIGEDYFDKLVASAEKILKVKKLVCFSSPQEIYKLANRCVDWSYKQLRAFELLWATNLLDVGLDQFKQLAKSPAQFSKKRYMGY